MMLGGVYESKDFITETLTEILAGIRAAPKKEGGDAVGAQAYQVPNTANFFCRHHRQLYNR